MLRSLVYLADTSASFAFEFPKHLFGSGVYLLIVLLVITSFDGPARKLGSVNWRRLHTLGFYAIGIAFVQTLPPSNAAGWLEPIRLSFAILTSAAILMRLSAFIKRRR